jgi:hypothetical protein
MFHTRGLHVLGTTFSTTVFSGAAAVERQRPGLDLDDAGVVEGGQNLRRATASRPSVSCVVGVVSLGWSPRAPKGNDGAVSTTPSKHLA